ncbi:NAD(P)-binding protein [Trichoderma barbatum]
MPSFNSPKLPNLDVKVALVTGATSGLGLHTCIELAKHGARAYVGCRSESTGGNKAIQTIRAEVPAADLRLIKLELSDMESVRAGAKSFLEQESKLHILVNNGGIMAPPRPQTKQGYEIQFGVNYLSHFLLTKDLLQTLQATAAASLPGEVRVIDISSFGYTMAPKEGIALYGQSKLANILHTKEIARRYGLGDRPIISIAIDPGLLRTNLVRSPAESTWWFRFAQPLIKLRSLDAHVGASTQIYAAASPDVKMADNGGYFTQGPKRETLTPLAQNAKLWEWSDKQLSIKGII